MALTERLILLIDSKSGGAIRDIRRVQGEVDKLGDEAGKTGTKLDGLAASFGVSGEALKAGIAAGASAAGVALVAFGKKAVDAASALEEQTARITTLFGTAAQSVIDFAESANDLGLSDRAALQAAGSFGTLFTNIGQTDEAAAQMSIRMVQLAADLASFTDTSLDDALQAINSGLVGETEPLRQYGVLLNEATLKAQALKDGLITSTTAALSPAIKAQAAYNAILAQTVTAQGDIERTSGSLANQQRQLTANFEDLQATIGEYLLPAVTQVVSAFNSAVQAGIGLAGALDDIGNALGVPIEKLGFLGAAISPVIASFKFGPSAINGVSSALGGLGTASDGVLDSLRQNQAAMTAYFGAINQARAATVQYAAVAASTVRADLDAAAAHRNRAGAVRSLTQSILAAVQANAAYNESLGKPNAAAGALLSRIVDANRAAQDLGGSIGGGVVEGLDQSQEEINAFLRSIAQQAAQDLQDVFGAVGAGLNIGSANDQLADATDNLQALRDEYAGLGAQIAQQKQLVTTLGDASAAITPEEQVAIEQAEKNLERVRMAYLGLKETIAPSSFTGEDTIIEQVTPTATLAELQVAEQQLADARARATGPTRDLEEAQRKLDDLRERQAELPGLIADAERRLEQAQLGVVEAQLRLIDAGRELSDQNAEFIDQFRQIAENAGLSALAIGNLVNAMRDAALAAGLEDVFGNGLVFRTHADAEAIRNFISAQAGLPAFGNGGVVPGPVGSPQLVMAHAGETILPTHKGGGLMMGGVSINVSGAGDPGAVARAVRNELLKLQRYNGKLGFN